MKRKKQRLTAKKAAPKTRGKILRRAAFQITEIERDGEVSVDIEALDSQVRDAGKLAMFDNIYHMIRLHIESQCDDLATAIGDAINLRDKKGVEAAQMVSKLIAAEQKLEALRKIALNVQTGRGGSSIKSDPYTVRKQLMEVLAA